MNETLRPARVSVAGGIVLAVLVATLGEGGGAPSSLLAWHAVVAATLIVAVWVGSTRPVRPAGPDAERAAIAIGIFALLLLFGALRAPYAFAAWLFVLEAAASFVLALLAAGSGPRLLALLVWPVRIAGALHGGLLVLQLALGERRPPGTFLNPNHAALWLAMALLFGLGALPRERRGRAWAVGLALVAATGIALTGSRGALLAVAAGGSWLLLMRWRAMASRSRLAVVACALLLAGVGAWRLSARLSEHDPFRYHRGEIWKASGLLIAAEPWWGSGPGQFPQAARGLRFDDGDPPMRFDRTFTSTHSDLVRLPAELGLPAAAALLFALGFSIREGVRRRRESGLPEGSAGAIAALVAVAAQALVDNPSRWPSIYVLCAVLVGALFAREGEGRVRLRAPARLAFATVVLIAFVAGDVAPYLAVRAAHGLPRGRLTESELSRLDRSTQLNPLHPETARRRAEHEASHPRGWGIEEYASARESAEAAIRLQPADGRFHLALARIEADGCRTLFPDTACRERAVARFERAAALDPYNPFVRIGQAMFLLDTGEPARARRAAETALSLEPEAALTRLVLADAMIEAGSESDLTRAAELLGEAVSRAAHWSTPGQAPYVRDLMQVDPSQLDRLGRKLARAAAVGSGAQPVSVRPEAR